jgi:hypothetical protein
MYGCMLFSIAKGYTKMSIDTVGIIMLVICFFTITYIIHPEYKNYFNGSYHTDSECDIMRTIFGLSSPLFFYWLIRECNDFSKLWNTLKVSAIISLVLDLLSMSASGIEYEMSYGYRLEFSSIILLANFLSQKKRKYYLLMSLLGMLIAILRGSRGCIIGYVVFTVMYEIFIEGKLTLKKVLVFATGCLGYYTVTSPSIMMLIYNFISSFGISSRTLYFLATEGIFDLSVSSLNGRNRLYTSLIETIKESGLFTWYGAYGDRVLLNGTYAYAHNIILEMLITFGKFFGILICIGYIYMLIKNLLAQENRIGKIILLIFSSFSICRLFISSSFWYEPIFWGSIAIMLSLKSMHSITSRCQWMILRSKKDVMQR